MILTGKLGLLSREWTKLAERPKPMIRELSVPLHWNRNLCSELWFRVLEP
jgi:hypothetical protein